MRRPVAQGGGRRHAPGKAALPDGVTGTVPGQLKVERHLVAPAGHGLWLTRELADQVNVTAGPGGSQVTAAFTLRPR